MPNLKSWGDGRSIGSAPQFIQWKITPVAKPQGPWIIGISGPSGCGKSSLAEQLQHMHGGITVLSMDDFFDVERVKRFGHWEYPEGIDIDRFMLVNLCS